MRRLVLAIFLLLLSVPLLPAFALSDTDKALLKNAEDSLNAVSTLQARFTQVDPDGQSHEGDLYISRPGKMRLVYDPPTPMLMVADGVFLIYVDTQMRDVSHIDLNDTPAGLLLKKNLSFTDPDVRIEGVKEAANTLEIMVSMAKDPAAGKLTMVFGEAPFELKQWRVVDAQRKEVKVTLYNAKPGVKLDSKLFRYDAPKGGGRGDRGDRSDRD